MTRESITNAITTQNDFNKNLNRCMYFLQNNRKNEKRKFPIKIMTPSLSSEKITKEKNIMMAFVYLPFDVILLFSFMTNYPLMTD